MCPKDDGLTRAEELLREQLVRLVRGKKQHGGRVPQNLTVVDLFNLFLEVVQVERGAYTHSDYRRWLSEFARLYGRRKSVSHGWASISRSSLAWATGASKSGT